LRWGLILHWAKDPKIAYKTIKARVETVDTASSIRIWEEGWRKPRPHTIELLRRFLKTQRQGMAKPAQTFQLK